MSDLGTMLITDALVARIHADNAEVGVKELAYDTYFRHSDATACARKMAYSYLYRDLPDNGMTNPPDIAGEWVMWLGTNIHEHLQSSLRERFGSSVECEVKVRHGGLSSGHIDAVIDRVPGIGRIAYELKTKGSYGFDKAVGIDRRAYALRTPEGPGQSAKVQGALNAIAVDADLLVVGVIGMECVSKQLAERVGFDDLERFIGEWAYDKQTYRTWAQDELARMDSIRETIKGGILPPRQAVGDEGEPITLHPEYSRPDWRCTYCSFLDRCKGDGA